MANFFGINYYVNVENHFPWPFFVHFSSIIILYAFHVLIPSMIEKGSTDHTNQWFQITWWPFPARDREKVFNSLGADRFWSVNPWLIEVECYLALTLTRTHVSDRPVGDTLILVTISSNDLSGKIFGCVAVSNDRCDVNRVQKWKFRYFEYQCHLRKMNFRIFKTSTWSLYIEV